MKRSALYHLHARSGAAFLEHRGWQVPATFSAAESEAAAVREGVGLADVSYRAKYEGQNGTWRLNSRRYLTTGEPPLEAPADAVDVTSVYASLLLAGPKSRDVLRKLTSLRVSDDALPDMSLAQASVAHTHAIVLRKDIGDLPAFQILVGREYGESAWVSIVHAGDEFHLQPFGMKALELLQG